MTYQIWFQKSLLGHFTTLIDKMPKSTVKNFIYEIINDSLSENQFAKVLLTHFDRLDFSKKEKFYESILPHYTSFRSESFSAVHAKNEPDEITTSKDYRIRSIRLSNVRGIPASKDSVDYGIDFSTDNAINNAVILGGNGVGKSSIYNAIEFVYTNRIGEHALRCNDSNTPNDNTYREYLCHFNNLPNCTIETGAGQFSLSRTAYQSISKSNSTFNTSVLFINDYDIYCNGQKNFLSDETDAYSFHYLIASSLGMQHLLQFNTFLITFVEYKRVTESRDKNKLENEKSNLKEKLSSSLKEMNEKEQQLNALEINDRSEIEDRLRMLFKSLQGVKSLDFSNIYFDNVELDKNIDVFKKAYDKFIAFEFDDNSNKEAELLLLGQELLITSDGCPLCNNSKSTNDEIKTHIYNRLKLIQDASENFTLLRNSIAQFEHLIEDRYQQLNVIIAKLEDQNSQISSYNEFSELQRANSDIIDIIERFLSNYKLLRGQIDNSKEMLLNQRIFLYNQIIADSSNILYADFLNFAKEINQKTQNRISAIDKIEKKVISNSELSNNEQLKSLLQEEFSNLSQTVASAKSRIETIDKQLKDLDNKILLFKKITSEAKLLSAKLDEKVSGRVLRAIEPIKGTIEDILSEYLKEENLQIRIGMKEKVLSEEENIRTKYIVAEIKQVNVDSKNTVDLSPGIYFNTFRFRLFCMMISLSIGIAARNTFGINTPLIIDDVFYASDYSNKTSFKEFFIKLFQTFKHYNSGMPLQFILFTHDDIVFDAILDAVSEIDVNVEEPIQNINWINDLKKNTKFLRLFAASDTSEEISNSTYGHFWSLTELVPTKVDVYSKGEFSIN